MLTRPCLHQLAEERKAAKEARRKGGAAATQDAEDDDEDDDENQEGGPRAISNAVTTGKEASAPAAADPTSIEELLAASGALAAPAAPLLFRGTLTDLKAATLDGAEPKVHAVICALDARDPFTWRVPKVEQLGAKTVLVLMRAGESSSVLSLLNSLTRPLLTQISFRSRHWLPRRRNYRRRLRSRSSRSLRQARAKQLALRHLQITLPLSCLLLPTERLP